MLKKNLLIAVAALGLSASAFATNGAPDIYVGGQLGYGDTHWDNLDQNQYHFDANGNLYSLNSNFNDKGFAAGALVGYDYNQYLGIEGGYVYFPKTKAKETLTYNGAGFQTLGVPGSVLGNYSDSYKINTYGLDVAAKITVPVIDNFGLFAKAGPGYLHSSASDNINGTSTTSHAVLVYGFGAQYQIMPNLVADVSFTRFNGHEKLDSGYQPDADLYAAGLAYKFNI